MVESDTLPEPDPTHLFGGVYFTNKYRESWWWMAAALCILAPPVGAVLVGLMAVACLSSDPEQAAVSMP